MQAKCETALCIIHLLGTAVDDWLIGSSAPFCCYGKIIKENHGWISKKKNHNNTFWVCKSNKCNKCKWKWIYSCRVCVCACEWKCVWLAGMSAEPCIPACINSNEGQMHGFRVTAREVWELRAKEKQSEDDSGRDEGKQMGRGTRYLSEVWFPMSASWKISPGKQRGYWEKERGSTVHNEVCTGRGIVCAFLCVSGDGRDTVHSSGIRGLMKIKKEKEMFGYNVSEVE